MITQQRLKEVVSYNEETGEFIRLKTGEVFGHLHNAGYYHASIDNQKYLLHRLAWLYVYGYMPNEIDHINRNKKDNSIYNLRDVTRQQNKMNQGPQSNNSSGERGIDFVERLGKFRVRVCKQHYGMYCTIEEAIAVRNKALASFF